MHYVPNRSWIPPEPLGLPSWNVCTVHAASTGWIVQNKRTQAKGSTQDSRRHNHRSLADPNCWVWVPPPSPPPPSPGGFPPLLPSFVSSDLHIVSAGFRVVCVWCPPFSHF